MPTYRGRGGRLSQSSQHSPSVLSDKSPKKRALQFCSAFYLDLALVSEPWLGSSFLLADKDVCLIPETSRTVWMMSLVDVKGDGVKKDTHIWWFSKRISQKKFLFTLCLFWTMGCDLRTEPLYAIAIEIGSTSIASDCHHMWAFRNISRCKLIGNEYL